MFRLTTDSFISCHDAH